MAKLISGTRIYGNTTIDTFLVVSGNNAANSISTGALRVSGGIGANGNVYSTGIYETVVSSTTRLFDSANLVINSAVSSNVATLRGEISSNIATINSSISGNTSTINASISSNVSTVNSSIAANVATLRGEISGNVNTINSSITANAASANAVINTNISANVATLRGEITANAGSANSVINTNISANVATLRGEISGNVSTLNSSITANAASANAVINNNISANVATLRGEITANSTADRQYTDARITDNVATLRGEITSNATTIGNQANAAFAKANLAITINTTEGISVSGTANLGGTITINNTGVKGIYVGARLTANAATGNVLLDLNTTSVIAGSYTYPSLQVDSYGRITTITNQQPVLSLSANAGTVTVSNSTGAISVGLPTVGTAGTYGGASAIPSFTTDAYGRITAISNTAVSYVSKAGDTMTGVLVIANTTNSVSNSTGALIVNGGVGISGNVFAQGNNATWAAVSNTSGYQMSMAVNDQLGSLGLGWGTNGVGQAGAFMAMSASGGKNFIHTTNRDFYITTSTGAVPFYLFSGSNNSIQQSNTTITSTIGSNSNTTGALIVSGGVGVTGNVYVGSGSVVGFSNTTSVSAAYQYYNAATNSLDTVFG